jgi:hypothetical protein
MACGAAWDGNGAVIFSVFIRRDAVARLDEGAEDRALFSHCLIFGRRHQTVAQAHEFIDVELVVREDDVILEVLGRRAAIMLKPLQA